MGRISAAESHARQLAAYKLWVAEGRPPARTLHTRHPHWAYSTLCRWVKQWKADAPAPEIPAPAPEPVREPAPAVEVRDVRGLAELALSALSRTLTDPKATHAARTSAAMSALGLAGHVPPKRGTPPPTDEATEREQAQTEARKWVRSLSTDRLRLLDLAADAHTPDEKITRALEALIYGPPHPPATISEVPEGGAAPDAEPAPPVD